MSDTLSALAGKAEQHAALRKFLESAASNPGSMQPFIPQDFIELLDNIDALAKGLSERDRLWCEALIEGTDGDPAIIHRVTSAFLRRRAK